MQQIRFISPCLVFLYLILSGGVAFAQTIFSSNIQGTLETGDRIMRSDGSLYDSYTFEGTAGQQVTVNLSSGEFDTYLLLIFPGREKVEENDDKNQNSRDSELSLTLPTTGTYTVIANSYNSESRGSYYMSLSSTNISSVLQNQGERISQRCTTAIASAVSRIKESRNFDVVVSRRNHSDSYSDYPNGRPIGYSFSLTGASAGIITDSPRLMMSITTDLIEHCTTVSMVSFTSFTDRGIPYHMVHGENTFGLFDGGQIKEFSYLTPGDRMTGGMRWGYRYYTD
jgi:hypothetical protein